MVSSLLAMDSAPLETDSPKGSCRFVKESQSLPLDAFASYYGHRLPQCALIDEIGSEEGTASCRGGDDASESSDTLSTGQLVAVFAEKNVPTIHARVEGAQQVRLSIPVACKSLQVAFLPPNDPETIIVNRSWERTFTSVSEILASSTLPPAFKVMEECCSYKSGCVETGIILFNIEMVHVGFWQQKAIQGTSMYGMKYTFLDGSRVFFSSRQCDTRCSLWECADIIRYPQKVTAFLSEEESREFPQLANLSELTLTGNEEKKYLLMCKMNEDGSLDRKLHTLPADSTTKVTAAKMENCDLVKVASSRIISKEHHRSHLPLPPTPSPNDEELYDEPDKLMQYLWRTNSVSTVSEECTSPSVDGHEEYNGTNPSTPLVKTRTSGLNLDTSTKSGTCVSLGPSGPTLSTQTSNLFAVCLEKEAVLQVVMTDSVGDQLIASVPVKTKIEFAFLPSDDSMAGSKDSAMQEPIRRWEGVFQSVEELLKLREDQSVPLPAALKVLDNALDHSRQQVPAQTILFNIHKVSQRVGLRKKCGIEGVDCSGTAYRFLEGENPLYFSTKLYDIKCSPVYFTNVLQFPQKARVYQNPNTKEEDEELLPNLSTITITEVSHDQYYVVRTLSGSGNKKGIAGTAGKDGVSPYFAIPVDAGTEVVGVTLMDSALMDQILASCHLTMASEGDTPPEAGITHTHNSLKDNKSDDERGTSSQDSKGPSEAQPFDEQYVAMVHNLTASDDSVQYDYVDEMPMPGFGLPSKSCHKRQSLHKPIAVPPREYRVGRKRSTVSDSGRQPLNSRPIVRQGNSSVHQSSSQPCCSLTRVLPPTQENSCDEAPDVSHGLAEELGGITVGDERCTTQGVVGRLDSLQARPKESQLGYHVAAKLGQDWYKVCTYLGLQHYQLEQADEAHSQLENKAMKALVMWLRGQEELKAPHSWNTLLQAIRYAGRNDMASKLEKDIRSGRLLLS